MDMKSVHNKGVWQNSHAQKAALPDTIYSCLASNGMKYIIVRFTLNSSTRIIEFRGFLSQFSTNFHEILHTLFSIHVVTTLKISRSFDKYFRS